MTEKEREMYFLKRKRKKILLKEIAKHLGCSISWLSRFETGVAPAMSIEKMEQYRRFIDNY